MLLVENRTVLRWVWKYCHDIAERIDVEHATSYQILRKTRIWNIQLYNSCKLRSHLTRLSSLSNFGGCVDKYVSPVKSRGDSIPNELAILYPVCRLEA